MSQGGGDDDICNVGKIGGKYHEVLMAVKAGVGKHGKSYYNQMSCYSLLFCTSNLNINT